MFGLDEYSAMAESITPPACLLEKLISTLIITVHFKDTNI